MSISRRTFSGNALALAFASALFNPDDAFARPESGHGFQDDAPHDAYEFWNGFFDSVNMAAPTTSKGARAGTAGLADPAAETQYLHYKAEAKQLRYATDISQTSCLTMTEMLRVSIQLSKFRPGSGTDKSKNQQLRIDATQTHAYMNLLAPLAWTAIASLKPGIGRQDTEPGRTWIQIRSGDERHQQYSAYQGYRQACRECQPTTQRYPIRQSTEGHDHRSQAGCADGGVAGGQRARAQRLQRGFRLLGGSHSFCDEWQSDNGGCHPAGDE